MVLLKFSHEQTVRLIELYRDQECLWRTDVASYRDKDARNEALEHIRKRLNIFSLTVEDVKKKLKYLRCTYKAEQNKVEKSRLRNGVALYKPALAWFDQMDCFIKDADVTRTSLDSVFESSAEYTEHNLLGALDDSDLDLLCDDLLLDDNSLALGDALQTGFRKFSRDETSRFIKLYREQDCLWDVDHEDYRNKDVRKAAMSHIRDNLGMTDLTLDDVKKKIKYIRATYMSEVKKIETSIRTGAKRVHKPCLSWFKEMDSFIKEQLPAIKRKPRNKVETQVKIECYDLVEADEESQTPSYLENLEPSTSSDGVEEPANKRPRLSDASAPEAADASSNSQPESLDEFEIFAKHVAVQLRSLALAEALKAQEAIQSILTRFRLARLQAGP